MSGPRAKSQQPRAGREGAQISGIRFMLVADVDERRIAEAQRIFRSMYGEELGGYADRFADMLRRQHELGYRVIMMTAEQIRGRVLAFALAFHVTEVNASLLDFIVVDKAVRQRGVGGALYEALREYFIRLGSRGLYLEVRPEGQAEEPDTKIRRENAARIRFYERLGVR